MVMKNEHFIPDLKNRYFTEDIPYGIVIVKSLAIILKEETPQIDNILFWAQDKLKKSYFSDKITFGKDFIHSAGFQNYNINSIYDLLSI